MHCCLVIALRLHCTACTLSASVQVVVEKAERKYGEFTQTFKIPQEYERKWSKCIVSNGVLKLVFKPDNDEEGLQVDDEAGKDEASHE